MVGESVVTIALKIGKKKARLRTAGPGKTKYALDIFSGGLFSVQQLVSFMAAGFTKKLIIEFDDVRILVRLADRVV